MIPLASREEYRLPFAEGMVIRFLLQKQESLQLRRHMYFPRILRHSLPPPLFPAIYSTMKRRPEEEKQTHELPFSSLAPWRRPPCHTHTHHVVPSSVGVVVCDT